MNAASHYKDFKASRGINYHYFCSESKDSKPTIIFLHGFPSTSLDWKHQIAFFKDKGYGLIVPDLLGYGGTDRPADVNAYKMTLMSKDIVDIIDHEQISKAICIGHDWGCGLASRLANYHPERFLAFGFLAGGYIPPDKDFDLYALIKILKQAFGSDIFGYWPFFAEADAGKVISDHFDSFFSVLYPGDPTLWKTDMAPLGALKAYCLADKKGPLPSYLTEADKEERRKVLLKDNLNGGLNWYKSYVHKITTVEDALIPEEKYKLQLPVFYAATLQDYICLPATGKDAVSKHCSNATVVDFDTDHWVQLAAPEKLNNELLKWIEKV